MKLRHDMFTVRQREPFTTHKEVVTETQQLLLQLDWNGCTGLGTVLIGKPPKLKPEQLPQAIEVCIRSVAGASPFHLADVHRQLAANAVPPPAVAGLDMALHDLIGHVTGLPLRQYLGLAGLPVGPTGLSLGVLAERELLERARRHVSWPILKLKMTTTTNVEVVGRVREIYPGRIWVDGNGCWDLATAIEAARRFAGWGVELLEQPVPLGRLDLLRAVREGTDIPIVADEDSLGPEDAVRLGGSADVFAIKLHRCGGLRPAMDMIAIARAAGLKVMLGCVSESALGITAVGQLAGLADYLDLDGSIDIADDPFTGIAIEDGRIVLPDGPGLGIGKSKIAGD